MLTLFSAASDVLTKYAQTGSILLPNFTKLVRRCLTAASNASNPTGEHRQSLQMRLPKRELPRESIACAWAHCTA